MTRIVRERELKVRKVVKKWPSFRGQFSSSSSAGGFLFRLGFLRAGGRGLLRCRGAMTIIDISPHTNQTDDDRLSTAVRFLVAVRSLFGSRLLGFVFKRFKSVRDQVPRKQVKQLPKNRSYVRFTSTSRVNGKGLTRK